MGGEKTREPSVRIRCRSPDDEARCRRVLEAAGYSVERSLTWLVVRDAHPDEVNEVLVRGGARSRVAAREQIGKLVGYLIDRQGDLATRGPNLHHLARQVLADAGLAALYEIRPEPELVESALRVYAEVVESGAQQVSWERFLAAFCRPATPPD